MGELDTEGVQGSDWIQDLLANPRYTRLTDQRYDKNTNKNKNTKNTNTQENTKNTNTQENTKTTNTQENTNKS